MPDAESDKQGINPGQYPPQPVVPHEDVMDSILQNMDFSTPPVAPAPELVGPAASEISARTEIESKDLGKWLAKRGAKLASATSTRIKALFHVAAEPLTQAPEQMNPIAAAEQARRAASPRSNPMPSAEQAVRSAFERGNVLPPVNTFPSPQPPNPFQGNQPANPAAAQPANPYPPAQPGNWDPAAHQPANPYAAAQPANPYAAAQPANLYAAAQPANWDPGAHQANLDPAAEQPKREADVTLQRGPKATAHKPNAAEFLMGLPSATSTKLKAMLGFQKSKTASEVDAYDLPESDWLTRPQSDQAVEESVQADQAFDPGKTQPELTPWNMPEAKSTQVEKLIKKEFLGKSGPKYAMRPMAKAKVHGKGERFDDIRQWFREQRLKLAVSAGAVVLVFLVWLIGHSLLAQQFVSGGIEQLKKGQVNDALASFDRAIQVDGQNADAYLNRGNAYRKKGELKKALEDYSRSLKMSPQNPTALDSRGSLSLQSENYQQALSDYTLLLGVVAKEKKAPVYDNRAAAYSGLGQYDKALQDYALALNSNPKDIKALSGTAFCFLQQGHDGKAVAQYNVALALDPHNSDACLGRGFAYQKQKNFVRAAKDFQSVLKQNAHNERALLCRADLYAAQGSSAKAFDDLATVLHLNAKSGHALMDRAALYANKGDFRNAIKDYNQAEKIPQFKANLALYLNRAGVYRKMKELEDAVDDYTTAIELSPKEYHTYISRGQCYQLLKESRKAVADYTSAIEITPKTAELFQQRGTLYEQSDNPLSAYKDYTTAISLDPKYIDPYISRARCSLAKQDLTAALQDYDRALKIDTHNAAALAGRKQTVAAGTKPKLVAKVEPTAKRVDLSKFTTADLIKKGYGQLNKGSSDDAIYMLSEAVKRDRNDKSARRYLAHALVRANRMSEAIAQFEALQKLGELDPADKQVLEQATTAMRTGNEQNKAAGAMSSLIAQYQNQVQQRPNDYSCRYNLALTYIRSGMLQSAMRECTIGTNATPPQSEWHQKFSALYASLTRPTIK